MNFDVLFETIVLTSNLKKYFVIILIAGAISGLLSGCLGTSYLKKDEKLLYKQKFEGTKGFDKEELTNQLETHTNRRWPIVNWSYYVSFYHIGEKYYKPELAKKREAKIREKYDPKIARHSKRKAAKLTAKKNKRLANVDRMLNEGNFFMRWGEKIQVYDSMEEVKSLRSLKGYLSTLGFFDAKVSFDADIKGKIAEVNYTIDRGEPYLIDSVRYNISDQSILSLVMKNQANTHLRKRNQYDQSNLTQERDRITNLLNNTGYYTFNKQYISFQVDTASLGQNQVLIQMTISNPENERKHQQYRMDSVVFITNSKQKGKKDIAFQEKHNQVTFVQGRRRFSPKILDWRLFLYPDSLYRKNDFFETQRQLSNLDIFKFVNIRNDTSDGKFITRIVTSPLKKYQTSNEIGVNVNQGLPGPFFNVSLKNRNSFSALEILELSGKLGVEGVGSFSDQQDTYSSLEYGGNLSQTFPQFLFPFSRRYQSKVGRLNPSTKFTVGLNYIDRPEYRRNNLFGAVTYSWQKGKRKSFSFTPIEVNYIISSLRGDFEELLNRLNQGNDRLINSFRSSFITSANFTKTLNINTYGNRKRDSYYAKFDLESGGALLNVIGERPLGDSIQYFQYLRFITDLRAVVPINKRRLTVYRVSLGAAYSYGESGTLPYEKFLFAGGSNSIRAWKPRRLGPGSFQQVDDDGNIIESFEQPATLLFEANIESRFKLFSFFEGALFLDMGNSWLLEANEAKPGAEFSFNDFYREIAIGTGFGLRLDFSLLILRLDLGLKLRDPTRDEGERFLWNKGFTREKYRLSSPLVLNIGIGYPF